LKKLRSRGGSDCASRTCSELIVAIVNVWCVLTSSARKERFDVSTMDWRIWAEFAVLRGRKLSQGGGHRRHAAPGRYA